MELGEHPAAAARREVAEELGAIVRLTGLLDFSLDPHIDDIVAVVTFLGEIDGDLDERPRDWLRRRRSEPSIGFGISPQGDLGDTASMRAGVDADTEA